VQAFADAAVAKAEHGSTAPVPGGVSITSASVRTVATRLGTVACRAVGSGPPLVLVMGYGGTISIDAMANQTSALITALGLHRPDVLGWSMGTMIAQALAALHPDQVNRLVLGAGYPGNGAAVRPPQQAINALNTGGQQALAELFPAGQAGARNAYLAAISSYPPAPAVLEQEAVAAQGHAIDAWWAGQDLAGARAASITAPTLIADGAADQLDPAVNSRTLAGLIPGAAHPVPRRRARLPVPGPGGVRPPSGVIPRVSHLR
jgi:pimeloyl-ACP methyl ester carboxylesterase